LPDAASVLADQLRIEGVGGAPLGVSQESFEGLNQPNVAIGTARPAAIGGGDRRALPPGRYWLRPVLRLNAGGRNIFGDAISVTVPSVATMNYNAAFTVDLETDYCLISPALPAATRNAMRQAFEQQLHMLVQEDFGIQINNNTFTYAGNGVNIRLLPGNPAPAGMDYVMPVNIGGGVTGSGGLGLSRLNIFNQWTDSQSLSGGGRGVFPSALLTLYGNYDSMFTPFRAPAPGGAPYGALPADNTAGLQAVLAAGIVMAPPVPGGGVAAWNRDHRAQNAAVALCRITANTISHEMGHTMGLVYSRPLLNGIYLAPTGPYGIPIARADNFRVGTDTPVGDQGHNGHVVGVAVGNPGAQLSVLPLYSEAGPAGVNPPGGVSRQDDLQDANTVRINYIMDSGLARTIAERVETDTSGVQPLAGGWGTPDVGGLTSHATEEAGIFLVRNYLYLQQVLPRDVNP
jgi:hypothetical protein